MPCHAARARELLEKGKGLEHNRLPLKLIQAHLGEKQLFPRYAKEKATRQASSSYFFILVIFIYFWGAFSSTESNFFPGKVPANREDCKPRYDRRFVRTLQFEKQLLSRSGKEDEKVTFIQVKGNLFPGSRGAKTTFIHVQSNFSHGILDVMVTFIQVWRPASRPRAGYVLTGFPLER
jgi:hypothetical protein